MFASLRSRLLLILLGVTLPVALVACGLAYRSYRMTEEAERQGIVRDTALLASRLSAVPLAAERLAATIVALGDWRDASRCESQLRAVQTGIAAFSDMANYAGFAVLGPNGVMCEVAAKAGDAPSLVAESLQLGLAGVGAGVVRLSEQHGSGRSLLWAVARGQPDANPDRAVLLVVDTTSLQRVLGEYRGIRPGVAMLLDRTGHVISGPGDGADASRAIRRAALTDTPQEIVHLSDAGSPTLYASAKLLGVDVWLATAQREQDILKPARHALVLASVTPLLLLLIAGMALWVGLSSNVLSWVGHLRTTASRYAAGDLSARVGDTSRAPREFVELASAFDLLAGRVAERAQALEHEVAAKSGYIRELHHRVKNTLQVIGSLISLQKREVGPAERAVLRFPEDRVNAMSAAFRASYAVSELGRAPLGGLVRELIHRLQGSAEGRPADFAIELIGEEHEVDLDAAISVAMLLAELLPPYVDASSATGLPVRIEVVAHATTLDIIIGGPVGEVPAQTPLSRRFTKAYLRQLNATLEQSQGGETRLHAPYPG